MNPVSLMKEETLVMPVPPLFRMLLFCSLGMFTLVLFFKVVLKYYLPSLLSFLVSPLSFVPRWVPHSPLPVPTPRTGEEQDSQPPPRPQFPGGPLAGTVPPSYSKVCTSFPSTFWEQREVSKIFPLVPPSTNPQLTSELKGVFLQSQERWQRRMGTKSI